MMFEGGEIDNATEMVDWLSTTGTSDLRVNWTKLNPRQKSWIWTENGEVDLGDVELFGQPDENIWQTLRADNPQLGGRVAYQLYQGERRIQ
jgi:hypothetical protein